MDFLVDPILYAVPSPNGTNDAHTQFVNALSRWSEVNRSKQHNFYVWQDCIDALYEADCFPDPQKIRQLWQYVGEEVISPDLAYMAWMRFLEPPYLDDILKDPSLAQMLIDESSFLLNPDLIERLPPIVAEAFKDTLAKLAYIKETDQESPVSNLQLLTHPIAGEPLAEISAHVMTNEESVDVQSSFPLITDPDELDAFQNLTDLWPDVDASLHWLMRDMIRQGQLAPNTTLAPYFISPTFIDSIHHLHAQNSESRLYQIMRKSVLLLTGNLPPDPTSHHTFDKHKQRFYEQWGAWRLHVTGSPLALRLHYWRHQNLYILMHIVPFDNMHIAKPPADAFC